MFFDEARMRALLRLIVFASAAVCLMPGAAVWSAEAPRELRWAGDPEGGAPFVEADPARPDTLVGFDVEIAELIARALGRRTSFVNITFTSIDLSIERGDADIGLGGIEDTAARRAAMATTVPYYRFREVLSVRDADAPRFRTFADLRGRRVGTLGGTIAYEILLRAERDFGIVAVSYDDDVHPYDDLVLGRVDAVLLDHVLAERRRRSIAGFTIQPDSLATGHYVGVLAAENAPLRDGSTKPSAARCATARWKRSFASGGSGMKTSRRSLRGFCHASRCSRSSVWRKDSRPRRFLCPKQRSFTSLPCCVPR
jgi:polar amino acid transport system substrate-binding protein